MPLFGYKYPECGATVEKLQKFEDRPPLCHSCGDAQPGDAAMIREALLWNIEECTLSLCLDALHRLEIAAGRRDA